MADDPRCKMLKCKEPVFRLGVCLGHWEWLNGVRKQVVQTMQEAVRKQEQPNG